MNFEREWIKISGNLYGFAPRKFKDTNFLAKNMELERTSSYTHVNKSSQKKVKIVYSLDKLIIIKKNQWRKNY